ncbi:branched-chain amino acid ABC transporter permease [Streptomyces sp. NPDC091412]|uniref:branched-chain amino acid ABC transporter permease n=1 Tax=Streptomyces sp. NPDC091412 TaxID=3366002 RepID=UPI0037FA9FF2
MPNPTSIKRQPLVPLTTLVALCAIVTIAVYGSVALGNDSLNRAVALGMVSLIAVVGLHVFIGNSGVASFGHAAFLAIGGYVTAAVRVPAATKQAMLPDLPGPQTTPFLAVLLGGLAAAVVAFTVGLVLMRLNGLAAGLSTFALLSIVYVIASNTRKVTGGVSGVFGVPQTTNSLTVLPWVLFSILVAWAFAQTRLCLRLRASREDEVAARSIGIDVLWERLGAFTLSAFLTGISGSLMAMYLGSFNPDAFYLSITLIMLAMLVVGGVTSLSGAVLGAIFVSALRELLRMVERGVEVGGVAIPRFEGLQQLGTAVVLLLVLLLRPRGLTEGREILHMGTSSLWRPVRGLVRRRDDAASRHADETRSNSDAEAKA